MTASVKYTVKCRAQSKECRVTHPLPPNDGFGGENIGFSAKFTNPQVLEQPWYSAGSHNKVISTKTPRFLPAPFVATRAIQSRCVDVPRVPATTCEFASSNGQNISSISYCDPQSTSLSYNDSLYTDCFIAYKHSLIPNPYVSLIGLSRPSFRKPPCPRPSPTRHSRGCRPPAPSLQKHINQHTNKAAGTL